MKIRLLMVAGAAALLLAACGGGDDGVVLVPPPTGAVPQSATASISAWTQFIASLTGSTSDSSQPLTLDGINPPTSETAEPSPVT